MRNNVQNLVSEIAHASGQPEAYFQPHWLSFVMDEIETHEEQEKLIELVGYAALDTGLVRPKKNESFYPARLSNDEMRFLLYKLLDSPELADEGSFGKIIMAGVPVDIFGQRKFTALHFAVSLSTLEVIQKLELWGARRELRAGEEYKGWNALEIAIGCYRDLSIVEHLCTPNAPFDINSQHQNGQTALDLAREIRNRGAEQILLRYGARSGQLLVSTPATGLQP